MALSRLPPFRRPQISLNGGLLWRFVPSGVVLSQPAVSGDDTVYFGDDRHRVYALSGADGSLSWGATLGGLIAASPALDAAATVYIGSADGRCGELGYLRR